MDRVVVVVTWGRGEGYRYYNGIIDAWQNTRVEVVHLSPSLPSRSIVMSYSRW